LGRITLSDVAGRAYRNDDVVEGGSVGRRVVGVRALTILDHVALIARLLARLHKAVVDIRLRPRCGALLLLVGRFEYAARCQILLSLFSAYAFL